MNKDHRHHHPDFCCYVNNIQSFVPPDPPFDALLQPPIDCNKLLLVFLVIFTPVQTFHSESTNSSSIGILEMVADIIVHGIIKCIFAESLQISRSIISPLFISTKSQTIAGGCLLFIQYVLIQFMAFAYRISLM